MFGLGASELMILFVGLGAVWVVAKVLRGAAGGAVKRCAFCQSNIPRQAVVCRHCQRDQPG